MDDTLVYIGTAFKKMKRPVKGSSSLFTTGIWVVAGKESMPDITVGLSPERILSRVKLRALVEVLSGLQPVGNKLNITAYVNDDYIEYSYNTGQVLDELVDYTNGRKTSIRDMDLWKPMIENIRRLECRFILGTGALLLGMCNEAAAEYIRSIEV